MGFSIWRRLGVAAVAMSAATWASVPTLASTSACKLAQVGRVPLDVEGGDLLVHATINGTPVRFAVDTGAYVSLITRPAAKRLGLKTVDGDGNLIGVDGTSRLLKTTMDTLQLGTMKSRDVQVSVGGYRDFGATEDVIGVLGMDFLERYDMEFDVAHKLLNLYHPKGCDDVVLAYWSKTYNLVDMEDAWASRSRIRLIVKVNGQTAHAQLDSGAGASVLDEDVARRAGVTVDSPGTEATGPLMGINGYRLEDHSGVFDSVSIGDETIRHTRLRFADLYHKNGEAMVGSHIKTSYNDIDMFLGADFLKAHRVYIAFSQRKIYFTYAGGPVFLVKGAAATHGPDANGKTQP